MGNNRVLSKEHGHPAEVDDVGKNAYLDYIPNFSTPSLLYFQPPSLLLDVLSSITPLKKKNHCLFLSTYLTTLSGSTWSYQIPFPFAGTF